MLSYSVAGRPAGGAGSQEVEEQAAADRTPGGLRRSNMGMEATVVDKHI